MFRYAVLSLVCVGLLSVAAPAKASSISVCSDTTGFIDCTFNFNGSTSGVVSPLNDGVGYDPLWLVGYTFLMNPGFNYTSGTTNVFGVVVFSSTGVSIFNNLDPLFASTAASALALTPILGNALSTGQIVGTPFFPGAQQNGGIGIVNASGSGWSLLGILAPGFSGDSITVGTPSVNPTPVPEPATLTLFGLGAAVAGVRRWRTRRSEA